MRDDQALAQIGGVLFGFYIILCAFVLTSSAQDKQRAKRLRVLACVIGGLFGAPGLFSWFIMMYLG